MALTHCPECGREVSDLAAACIHCGYPLRATAPMTFWKTVGAILCALAIWTVAGFLLASLLHAF
ncbi:zinc-ribbon domain-containing protein [Intestinimonas timonensis]|uniref:zinc-ribbon domain-containing protein n=1 Tax=Intestinimonas timonensis TaxID=1689270 RepID=UPI00102F4FA8|nr:zinc-ribbon domain-containing protein [Intestinimonas timonensis]